jgi:hypothetical protein
MSIITTHSLAAVPSAHRNVFFVLAKVRRALNGWVAAYLALVERRSTAWALRAINERNSRTSAPIAGIPSRRPTSGG